MPAKTKVEMLSSATMGTHEITMFIDVLGERVPETNIQDFEITETVTIDKKVCLGDRFERQREVYGTLEGRMTILPGNGIWPALANRRHKLGRHPDVNFLLRVPPEQNEAAQEALTGQRNGNLGDSYSITLYGIVFSQHTLLKASSTEDMVPVDITFGANDISILNLLPNHEVLDITSAVQNRVISGLQP